ncbi:23S rRNA (guanosine(2251)-2'-O)-methyltransferase RlmB [Candidatus Endobugula sertula]|uniref:23S rRNA (Guanosine(2251)-2'-O)-methyltransferase RlmB n=1 Tax=Candidatus Endobugula sertula TaxID=62101 RepID=A0A1D2QR71_9GAMM|nr:23S rRNA (guanosine(2251)-2'-O)-methyltransferase RlmB [Candidatus Endobugula sertula]
MGYYLANQRHPRLFTKKQFFNQLVTLYGRKPVLEVLNDHRLAIYRVHLAESNKTQGIINEIITQAQQRCIDIVYHSRQALSRISKNSKQDQGVCVDVLCPQHKSYQSFLASHTIGNNKPVRLIALDRITNPQNLGMIIRSVCAGRIDGLLLPEKGCAKIDALVVKASAGTLFKVSLLHCQQLVNALKDCQHYGAKVYGLSSHAKQSISDKSNDLFIIYVLGNETEGMSQEVRKACDELVHIPMNNGVESLNVAVTASLLAFKDILA